MNKEDRKSLYAFIIIVFLMFVVSGLLRMISNQNKIMQEEISDTTYIHDTIIKPVSVKDTVLRMDTLTVIKNRTQTDIQLIHDTLTDSIRIVVPISQRTYDDSTYHAVISGYNPSLDTMIVHNRTITNTITKTVTKTKVQRLGLGISGGYDPIHNVPSLTIGLNFNILGIK